LETKRYTYIWEYAVPPESDGRFRAVYGPGGEWVRLFERGEGHVETRLYRDRYDPCRYVTIDVWESESAFRRFREEFAAEFDALDAACEALTRSERSIGELLPIDSDG
jgi:heme-degrading monooxygenase HmoA